MPDRYTGPGPAEVPEWEPRPARPAGAAVVEPDPKPQAIAPGFPGKVAVVTGGATGLGRTIAHEFARLGCNLAFCYVSMPGRDVTDQAVLTETSLKSTGVGVLSVRCDVRDARAVERFVAKTKERFGA